MLGEEQMKGREEVTTGISAFYYISLFRDFTIHDTSFICILKIGQHAYSLGVTSHNPVSISNCWKLSCFYSNSSQAWELMSFVFIGRYKLSLPFKPFINLVYWIWCFRRKQFRLVSEKSTHTWIMCSKPSTTLSYFWCSSRLMMTQIINKANWFFFTRISTERPCSGRKW